MKLEPIIEKRLFVQFLRSAVSSCSKQLTDDKPARQEKLGKIESQTITGERAKRHWEDIAAEKGLKSKFFRRRTINPSQDVINVKHKRKLQ